jgi:E3 UFM1-protein ligase 1
LQYVIFKNFIYCIKKIKLYICLATIISPFQVKGRLEGGQLYTPAYVSRITAMVRGAARGITVPTNLPSLWNSLQQQLQEMHGASGVSVEGSFFQSIFNGLLKEGAVLGSVRAGGQWTPAVRSAIV